jgi:Fe-S oxidoreductase
VEPTREEFLHISAPEKALFYLLVFAALAVMAWQIRQRFLLWQTGKPLDESKLNPGIRYWIPKQSDLKRWLKNIGIFVFAQKKVRSSRKRSGAPMHLFIFYGFMGLVLATTLLGINTYSPWKFHRGLYYEVYESSFDAVGLVFIAGVLWAFVRRIGMTRTGNRLVEAAAAQVGTDPNFRPQLIQNRRAPLSSSLNDFLTLGLLLTVALTGYWLEAARISNNLKPWDEVSFVGYAWAQVQGRYSDSAYRGVWWFHTFWVLLFFIVIPRMRIKHIVNAFFVVAGNPQTPMGQLKPVTLEEVEKTEQVGVKMAKDYSRWHLMSLDACMECGRCTEVCPAWNVGKVLNPKQIVQEIRGAMQTGEAVAPRITEEALWQCTTCNACTEACPVLIRHVDLIVDVRRNLVSEGALSGTAATMLRQIASSGNAWGKAASDREDWMSGLEIPLCRQGVEFDYLFWVGCAGATDPGAIKTTRAVASLLAAAGIKFACLGREEACTGDPARRVGEEFLFQEKAAQNVSVFEKYEVKRVVTACPHCFNSLKNEYGQMGATLEVYHHTQLLSELVSKGALIAAKPARGDVALHDPCYLARVNEEIDAPRSLVENMSAPPEQGKKTLCCGAGGGRMWMDEPPTQRPANRRAEGLLATGATTVAVACPFCRIMLGDSLKQARPNDEVRLVDLAELLLEAQP